MKTAFIIALLLTMLACKTTGNENTGSLNIKRVFAGGQCGGQDKNPGLQVLSNRRDLEKVLATDKQLQSEWPAAGAGLNFDAERIVFISMGLKRTGGYGLELADVKFQVQNGRAIIRIRWHEPSPGSIVTQALTSPCLFIAMPRRGYGFIRVVDPSLKIQMETAVDIKS